MGDEEHCTKEIVYPSRTPQSSSIENFKIYLHLKQSYYKILINRHWTAGLPHTAMRLSMRSETEPTINLSSIIVFLVYPAVLGSFPEPHNLLYSTQQLKIGMLSFTSFIATTLALLLSSLSASTIPLDNQILCHPSNTSLSCPKLPLT